MLDKSGAARQSVSRVGQRAEISPHAFIADERCVIRQQYRCAAANKDEALAGFAQDVEVYGSFGCRHRNTSCPSPRSRRKKSSMNPM